MADNGETKAGSAQADETSVAGIDALLEKGFDALDNGTLAGEEEKPGENTGEESGEESGGDNAAAGEEEESAGEENGEEEPGTDDDDSGDENAGEEEDDPEVKKLPDHVQEKINKRISKVVAKQKDAEERAESAEARAVEAEEKLKETETRMSDAERQEAYKLGIHPDYLEKDEREIIKHAEELEQAEDWLFEHLDGYEAEKSDERSYTAAEIRRRYNQVRRELMKVGARAEGLRSERMKLMLEDMRAGRELRLNPDKKKAADTDKGKKDDKGTPDKDKGKPDKGKSGKPPPARIAGVSGGGKPPVSMRRESRGAFDAEAVGKADNPVAALQEQLERVL